MSHFYIQQWNRFRLYRKLSQQSFIFVGKENIRDENIAYFRHAWLSQTVARFATG